MLTCTQSTLFKITKLKRGLENGLVCGKMHSQTACLLRTSSYCWVRAFPYSIFFLVLARRWGALHLSTSSKKKKRSHIACWFCFHDDILKHVNTHFKHHVIAAPFQATNVDNGAFLKNSEILNSKCSGRQKRQMLDAALFLLGATCGGIHPLLIGNSWKKIVVLREKKKPFGHVP